ncbi:hypothetical protein [Pseudomonas juntendi]|uniref:hypothetical protein n=1 Tax=Pseudomonas juntendi TaxID=2666183 RepID=UPI003B92879A
MSMLIGLMMVFLFGPAITFLLMFVAVRDLVDYYGEWLLPALVGLVSGVQLKLIGPSDPNLPFESLVEVIASSHIAGFKTSSLLIAVGVFSLLAKPLYGQFKRIRSVN